MSEEVDSAQSESGVDMFQFDSDSEPEVYERNTPKKKKGKTKHKGIIIIYSN